MTDTLAQYNAVREQIGFLDRSDLGRLAITGPDRFFWLQGMVSNDVRLFQKQPQEEGYVERLQACILDATGHLLSDLTLLNMLGERTRAIALPCPKSDFILVEMPRANLEKVASVFDRYLIMEDVEIIDVTGRVACLSLQGPLALRNINGSPIDVARRIIADNSLSFWADHTGSGGIDHYFSLTEYGKRKESLLQAGIPEIGPEAAAILRVEAGIPKYGADMDESVIALEAGLGPTHISLTKGCYVGQEIIARIDSRGHTNRALTGFVLSGDELPQPGEKLYAPDADSESGWKETGRLTSVIAASMAVNNCPIALGYARHEHRESGNILGVGSPDSGVHAETIELPFYRKPAS